MPIYTWRDSCDGTTIEVFRSMANYDQPPTAEEGAQPYVKYERVPNLGAHCSNKEFQTPIEMNSLGLSNDHDINEFRKRNPDVKVSSDQTDPLYGVPIAHSRAEKLKILKNEGWQEANGKRHNKLDLSRYF